MLSRAQQSFIRWSHHFLPYPNTLHHLLSLFSQSPASAIFHGAYLKGPLKSPIRFIIIIIILFFLFNIAIKFGINDNVIPALYPQLTSLVATAGLPPHGSRSCSATPHSTPHRRWHLNTSWKFFGRIGGIEKLFCKISAYCTCEYLFVQEKKKKGSGVHPRAPAQNGPEPRSRSGLSEITALITNRQSLVCRTLFRADFQRPRGPVIVLLDCP